MPINPALNPWDALDVLEGHARELDFSDRWRVFLRSCSILLLPTLPVEVNGWITAADDFEHGRLSAESLTAIRVKAWEFHDARQDTSTSVELNGLRAAMYRLWPPKEPDDWRESAWHFLHFCVRAGLSEEQWWPVLQAAFPTILCGAG